MRAATNETINSNIELFDSLLNAIAELEEENDAKALLIKIVTASISPPNEAEEAVDFLNKIDDALKVIELESTNEELRSNLADLASTLATTSITNKSTATTAKMSLFSTAKPHTTDDAEEANASVTMTRSPSR